MQYCEKAKEDKDLVSVMKKTVWQQHFSHQTRNQVPELQNGNTPTVSVWKDRCLLRQEPPFRWKIQILSLQITIFILWVWQKKECSMHFPQGIFLYQMEYYSENLNIENNLFIWWLFSWPKQKARIGVYSIESMIMGIFSENLRNLHPLRVTYVFCNTYSFVIFANKLLLWVLNRYES